MKKPILRTLVILGILLLGSILLVTLIENYTIEYQQYALAKELGVEIQDYPYQESFPIGYFFTVLKPGMHISKVHELIKGYVTVYHCKDLSEIYYYYSKKDHQAMRFEVFYSNLLFLRLQGEDEDSRTIRLDGCKQGVIEQ